MRVPAALSVLFALACRSTTTLPPQAHAEEPNACDLLHQNKIRVIGRFECAAEGLLFAWSGSGVELHFQGTGLTIHHSGPALRFARIIDGKVESDLLIQGGDQLVSVATDLPRGPHMVRLLRQGEALFGVSTIGEVGVLDGELTSISPHSQNQLELYGDSISCGYGNEGKNVNCSFSFETENHYLSYGALLARALGAELTTVAWSGKGVVRNFAGEGGPTLVDLASRALPESNLSRWDPVVTARAVIINLGTNDFSTEPHPPLADFVEAYQRLLDLIRKAHPQAFILCTVGPMLEGPAWASAERAIETAVQLRREAGDDRIVSHHMVTPNTEPGCDFHPSLATHQAMADELVSVLEPYF